MNDDRMVLFLLIDAMGWEYVKASSPRMQAGSIGRVLLERSGLFPVRNLRTSAIADGLQDNER